MSRECPDAPGSGGGSNRGNVFLCLTSASDYIKSL